MHPMMSIMGYTREQTIAVYRDQVARLQRKVADAAVATDFGANGANGKRYEGKFYHQIVGQYNAAVQSLADAEAINA